MAGDERAIPLRVGARCAGEYCRGTEPVMNVLDITPGERMTDVLGRPYFLRDCGLTLDGFESLLRDPDPFLQRFLGRTRDLGTWIFDRWEYVDGVDREA
jgi:hypothetical protein